MLSEILKKSVQSVMSTGEFNTAIELIGDLIASGVDIPESLEARLINFLEDKTGESFVGLTKEMFFTNLLEKNIGVNLVSFLVDKGWLELKSAAQILSSISHVERASLSEKCTKVVEVADLVYEDLKDNVMDVDDDDLLLRALKELP